jgi:hypothetical protein
MIRWKSLLLGASTFVVSHLVEAAAWSTWFQGVAAPWFLNSGRAVAFTAACVFAGGVVATTFNRLDRSGAVIDGCNVAGGAVGAMIVVLIAVGPGTIFPIVIAIGTTIMAASAIGGALAGWLMGAGVGNPQRE